MQARSTLGYGAAAGSLGDAPAWGQNANAELSLTQRCDIILKECSVQQMAPVDGALAWGRFAFSARESLADPRLMTRRLAGMPVIALSPTPQLD